MLLKTKAGRASMGLKNKHGQTPVHEAVKGGDLGVVRAVLAAPGAAASLTKADEYGGTPLHFATFVPRPDVARELIRTAEGRRAILAKDQ